MALINKDTVDIDSIYRLYLINDILNELKQERRHYETVDKKIKCFTKPYTQLNLHVIHHQIYLQTAML